MLIGTEGALLLPPRLRPTPLSAGESSPNRAPPEAPPRNHYHHFVDACLGKAKNESHFGQTGPMTEAILLGTVAIRTPDTVLQWRRAP